MISAYALEEVVNWLKHGGAATPTLLQEPIEIHINMTPQAKERARSGRGSSHHYTPKETRDFEVLMRNYYRRYMEKHSREPIDRSCLVVLTMYDYIDPRWEPWQRSLALAGMFHAHSGGDMDNKEKAVLDAGNGILYNDDKQIVHCTKLRKFSHKIGFHLRVEPLGLSKVDMANIARLMRG